MAMETELLQRLFDETDAMVYLKDEEGHFLLVNQRVAEALGSTKEELIGKSDLEVLDNEIAERFRAYDHKVMETGAPQIYEDTVDLPGGRMTLVDHKFPVSVQGHEHAVGGIAFRIKGA